MTMVHNFPPGPTTRKTDAARILKEMQSFAAFDRWIDDQLDRLVGQWIHTAAPNANRQLPIIRKLRRR